MWRVLRLALNGVTVKRKWVQFFKPNQILNQMINNFMNDAAYIALPQLFDFLARHRLRMWQLLHVTHRSPPDSSRQHYIGILDDDNLFKGASNTNPINLSSESPTKPTHRASVNPSTGPGALLPFGKSFSGPHSTDTIQLREIFHTAQAELGSLCAGMKTREKLDAWVGRNEGDTKASSSHIQDPPHRNIRGRPRTAHLTNLEGRRHTREKRKATAATGMTARAPWKCSRCHKPGHTHPNCTEDMDQGKDELDGDQYE
ncbi:hypothetical protein L218DRAFT_947721 [Marasmius fiardii PR-910]|nr:hypothetical protein L218DRAFT_947721 [Marasmius fiardii PR-910]